MKMTRILSIAALVCAAALSASPAIAHGPYHGGHHSGSRFVFGFNVGYPWPSYGYYPYYYPAYPYYPPYVVQQPPQVYVERAPEQQQAPGYWYYCADARAYYPYVKECPGGWQRVAPQPSN